jgi:hypothetical protein
LATFVGFGALGRTSRRVQTGALCVVALAKVAHLGVGCALVFWGDFSRREFCSVWHSATAAVKIMDLGNFAPGGPQNAPEVEKACFRAMGVRKRPIFTLSPIEASAQTPFDRPKTHFRRGPDLADAAEMETWRFSSRTPRSAQSQAKRTVTLRN